jgi:chromosomal replication initiation ATPase DnaA
MSNTSPGSWENRPPPPETDGSQPGSATPSSPTGAIDDFDFEFQPSVDRKLVEDLASLRFIDENRPVLFLGQPGCGKTHLAVALATRAVEAGYRGYSPPQTTCAANSQPP